MTAYLRDPEAIYASSFALIEAEADLAAVPPDMRDVAIRMIHACGDVTIATHIRASIGVVDTIATAIADGVPILCDSRAVAASISGIRRDRLIVTLDDPRVSDLARSLNTTRSAAAVDLWRDRLGGAVVVIGNAPTALFHLLELIDAGAPKPVAIVGCPVGFVGAADSKAALADNPRGIPFITLLGRQGGSAIAAAALNAIALRATR